MRYLQIVMKQNKITNKSMKINSYNIKELSLSIVTKSTFVFIVLFSFVACGDKGENPKIEVILNNTTNSEVTVSIPTRADINIEANQLITSDENANISQLLPSRNDADSIVISSTDGRVKTYKKSDILEETSVYFEFNWEWSEESEYHYTTTYTITDEILNN